MSVKVMDRILDQLPEEINAGQRMILIVLGNEARDTGECGEWSPEIPKLARRAGMSVRSVQRHLAELADPSEEACRKRGGLGPLLEIAAQFSPKDGSRTGSHYRILLEHFLPSQDGTPGVRLSPPPGDRLTPGGCQIVTGAVTNCQGLYEPVVSPVTETPPNPPAGGVSQEVQKQSATETAQRQGPEAVIAMAYAEATDGKPLPRKWKGAILREVFNGGTAMLLTVTAADIRAAVLLAEQKRRTFGFGWLLKHLEAQAMRRREREVNEARQREREAEEAVRRHEREQLEAAHAGLWATLTEEQQQEYRRRSMTPFMRAGAMLEMSARRLAYEELAASKENK